jgi:hypothetical protein
LVLFWEYETIAAPEFEAAAEICTGVISLAGAGDRAFVTVGLKLLPSDDVLARTQQIHLYQAIGRLPSCRAFVFRQQ